jgi:topoisomerase-4 subunit A
MTIKPTPFQDALGKRYLSYALSTITSRSLPDVRDGLKPVHRRILYAMRELKLNPQSGYKKAARVVGDVIGKFHPHGESSVYDALVRLAQDFSSRYRLVDGQGNFGNIDGDNPAAMRYTEARLTAVAWSLLEGLDENAVDFQDTYDNEDAEPKVLPAAFPNLLANGASGIAVGMATNIPSHNSDDIYQALLHLIKHPDATIEKLVKLLKGPDFATGGILVESAQSIVKSYTEGRGSFRIQARWHTEPLSGGVKHIIITEIPYQVQKSKLIEKIASLLLAKKLPLVADLWDESTDDVRLVIVPKSRSTDPAVVMASLFGQTDLETRFNLNMNVLDGTGVPRVMDIKEVLQAFLDHRFCVLRRRNENRLSHINNRLHMLAGYLVAYLNLDRVIEIIRYEDEPKELLMSEFNLSDNQADGILNMRLRSLRKLEEDKIRKENAALESEKTHLESLLASEDKSWGVIGDELKQGRALFGAKTLLGKRRTDICEPTDMVVDIPIEATAIKESITVLYSAKGWLRAVGGHQQNLGEAKYKEGDEEQFLIKAYTTDRLLFVSSSGKFFTLLGDKIQRGRGFGEPLRLLAEVPDRDKIVAVMVYKPQERYLLISTEGRGFFVESEAVLASTRTGKQVMNVTDKHELVICRPHPNDADSIAVVGTNRKLVIFPHTELPVMNRGRGVIVQKYASGKVSDVLSLTFDLGLSWQAGTRIRTEPDLRRWLGKRASAGRIAPMGFPKENVFDHDRMKVFVAEQKGKIAKDLAKDDGKGDTVNEA